VTDVTAGSRRRRADAWLLAAPLAGLLGLTACGPTTFSAPVPAVGQCITELDEEEDLLTGYVTIDCRAGNAGFEVVKVFSSADGGSCPDPKNTAFIEEASGPISKVWFVCLRPQR
jgi:hypothetical protein